MDLYTGARIKLNLKDGDVLFGFINYINTNEEDSVVALSKVEVWQRGNSKNKTRLPGVQRIQSSTIEELEILPESKVDKTASQSDADKKVSLSKNFKRKITPPHLKRLKELNPEKLIFGRHSSGGEDEDDEELIKSVFQENEKSSDYDSSSEVEDSYSTNEFTVLTKTDNLFHEAVRFIADKAVVGFAAEGVDIGRNGKLCWIQIDAEGSLFLFDMINLGQEGFNKGLKTIIQSESILKIIHDCRLLSDLLYHQYKIKILNVFDTQVAHVMAYRQQNRKDLPRYVPGLASCLYEHLNLPDEQIHIIRIREQAKSEDQEIWADRPAPNWLLHAAFKHVKHLIDLRMVLMEKMMVEFIAGVEIYLTYVRNSTDKEATDCQTKRHLLPIAFQHLHNFVSEIQRNTRYSYPRKTHQPQPKDPHGFRENSQYVSDPQIVPSKGAVWHANPIVAVNQKVKTPPGNIKKSPKIDSQNKVLKSPKVEESITRNVNNSLETGTVNLNNSLESSTSIVNSFESSIANINNSLEISTTSMNNSLRKSALNVNLKNSSESSTVIINNFSKTKSMPFVSLCDYSDSESEPEIFQHRQQTTKVLPTNMTSPQENATVSTLRQRIEQDGICDNLLRGITLLPAGLVKDNRTRKKYEQSEYTDSESEPEIFQQQQLTTKILPTNMTSPQENATVSTLRQRIEQDGICDNLLRGITLLPAGLVKDNRTRKKYEQSEYDKQYSHILQTPDISDDDVFDYGEIPTPQSLGRAQPRSIPLFASNESMSTSHDTASIQSNDSKSSNERGSFKNSTTHSPNRKDVTELNHKGGSIENDEANLLELQKKLVRIRHGSESSCSSVGSFNSGSSSNKSQQYEKLLKILKKSQNSM